VCADIATRRKRISVVDDLKHDMEGKKTIRLPQVMGYFTAQGKDAKKEGDWVLFAVVASKSEEKIASNKATYFTWKLTDLNGFTIPMTVFAEAATHHARHLPGTVLGILNPTINTQVRMQSARGFFLPFSPHFL